MYPKLPNCKPMKSDSDPVECEHCNHYFYLTPDKLCKSIPEEECQIGIILI